MVSEVRAGANDRLYAVLIDAAGPALIQELEGLFRVEDGLRLTGAGTAADGTYEGIGAGAAAAVGPAILP